MIPSHLSHIRSFDEARSIFSDFVGHEYPATTFRDFLSRMGWSAKIPVSFQLKKYTVENIAKYLTYLEWIQSVEDPSKIKFLDESHVTRKCLQGKKVYGMRNKRVNNRVQDIDDVSGLVF